MVSGAGSVAVSARPTLPNTVFTSGTVLIRRSVCCNNCLALPIEIPGNVVGMYNRSPSSSSGINSEPDCDNGHHAESTSNNVSPSVINGLFNTLPIKGKYALIKPRLIRLSFSFLILPFTRYMISAGTRVIDRPAAAAMA